MKKLCMWLAVLSFFLASSVTKAQTYSTSAQTVTATQGTNDIYVEFTGNDSNSGQFGSAKLTIASALAALGTSGGHIHIGCGLFSYSTPLNVTKSGTTMSGSGWGRQYNAFNGCTILNPSAGVTGIDIDNAGYVVIEDLTISSSSTSPGSDYGIHIYGVSPAPTLRNVGVEYTGSDGVFLDSTNSGSVDFWSLSNVHVFSAHGSGFVFSGINTNAGICMDCVATANSGWGKILNLGVIGNIFIACSDNNNTLGGTDVFAISNRFDQEYTETGLGSSFILESSALWNTVNFVGTSQPQLIEESVASTNTINYIEPDSLQAVNFLAIAGEPGAPNTRTWEFTAGAVNQGDINLRDLQDGVNAIECLKPFGNCVFGGNVQIPSQKSNSGKRYLCIDSGGNITSSATACSGT